MHKHLCQECLRNGKIEPATLSHHINEYRESFSELDFWCGELTALCSDCHFKIHGTIKHANSKRILVQMDFRWTPSTILFGKHRWRRKSGMDKAKQDAMEDCVRGILERAVTSLMALGMTDEAALSLLMIQSAIRIDDASQVVEVLESIARLIEEDDDDDDDDCAVSKGKGSGLD
jgi:hypothetical protein